MKYKFTKIDEDTTELSYKDKKFLIKKDIDLLTKMESLPRRARIKMGADLKLEGLTFSDLEVVKKEGNKTYVDKSTLVETEKMYQDIVANEILSEISQKYTQMSFTELLSDIEINLSDLGAEEREAFIKEFLGALREDKTPSIKIEKV